MTIPALIDQYVAELKSAGVQSPFKEYAQYPPATDADIEALKREIGTSLPADLEAWLRHVSCQLPFHGNYESASASRILESIQSTRTIDFSQHHKNIKSWKDGRFDDGRIAQTYWDPCWIPIARDGCGNEYCVDLAPGPKGKLGQLLAMEFQDGQGPYLATWETLEKLLQDHLKRMAEKDYMLEEGFLEFNF